MDETDLPNVNYVGMLQEKCSKKGIVQPEYSDVGKEGNKFNVFCILNELKTEGRGFSKKIAKQMAAKNMITELGDKLVLNVGSPTEKSDACAVSMLSSYCSMEKKDLPLYADKPKQNDEFVVSGKFENFECEGTGRNKKIAKENAAKIMIKHFEIDKYHANKNKEKERKIAGKNYIQMLYELCDKKKLNILITESKNISDKNNFSVSCSVGQLNVKSESASKKVAKIEACRMMIDLLNNSTPSPSPISNTLEEFSPTTNTKRKQASPNSDEDESSDEEPLVKKSLFSLH